MSERYGWKLDWFGSFVTVAAAVLGLALAGTVACGYLIDRWQQASSFEAERPALIMGSAIGDVPDAASARALAATLKTRAKGLPWNRLLLRRNGADAALAIHSLFFPTHSVGEALMLCERLKGPPGCAPVIARSDELLSSRGGAAGLKELARAGAVPYAPEGGEAQRVVYLRAPARIVYAPSKTVTKTVVVRSPPKTVTRTVYVKVPQPAKIVTKIVSAAPRVVTKVVQGPPRIVTKLVQAPAPPPRVITKVVQAPPRVITNTIYLPAPLAKTAATPSADLAMVQPALKVQPGLPPSDPAHSGKTIWLSASYRPGSAGLVDIVAAGDVMMGSIGSGLNPAIRPGADAAGLIGSDLATVFRHADIAFANLEGPLYDGPAATGKDCASCFAFHSPVYYADVLQSLGIDAVSLANNHSGDYGEAGRDSTIAALKQRGIGYGGLDRDGARFASLVLPSGKRAAVVAFAPNHGTLNLNDIPAAAALVRALKAKHDVVLVSFHGGGEGWSYVHVAKSDEHFDGEDRGDVMRFAHAVIDAGADIVIGQGPHVPRALELYRGHLIAYSLGNFWTYTGVNNYAVSGLGPVLEAWLAPDGTVAGFRIHSSRQAGLGVPHLDPLDEASRYVLYLTKTDFPDTHARLAAAERDGQVAVAGIPQRDTRAGTPGS
jgi:poly-gamma-glutamate capsule biosynthesis protein CapA/YwtB (metallophosphatase superfamily)